MCTLPSLWGGPVSSRGKGCGCVALLWVREKRVRIISSIYTQIPRAPGCPQSRGCRDPHRAGPQQGQEGQGPCLVPELKIPQSVSQRRNLELWESECHLRLQGNLLPLSTSLPS